MNSENGNTMKDLNRKVSSIHYNSLNLPSKMTFTDGSIFRYTYDAMGRKQKSSYHVGGDQMVGPVSPGTEPFPGILSLGGAELMDVPGQQSVTIVYDSIECCGNVLYDNGNLDKVFVDGGYATLNATTGQPTFHFYVRDHLGSVRRIVRQDGVVERTNHYYPYGGLHGESTGTTNHRFRFSGKEYDAMCGLNSYDFGARWQMPDLTRFGQMDPLAEKTPDVSPYAYCAGDPVNRIDPFGTDTIKISYKEGKWTYAKPVIAKGNDVFIVNDGKSVEQYEFSNSDYGAMVNLLNLEIGRSKSELCLGIYHISGSDSEEATGYYVTRGGTSSNVIESNRRINDGSYPMTTPDWDEGKWRLPGVGGSVSGRGIKFHFGYGNLIYWTTGCFLLSSDYTIDDNGVYKFSKVNSIQQTTAFCYILGAQRVEAYKDEERKRKYLPIRAYYPEDLSRTINIKTKK